MRAQFRLAFRHRHTRQRLTDIFPTREHRLCFFHARWNDIAQAITLSIASVALDVPGIPAWVVHVSSKLCEHACGYCIDDSVIFSWEVSGQCGLTVFTRACQRDPVFSLAYQRFIREQCPDGRTIGRPRSYRPNHHTYLLHGHLQSCKIYGTAPSVLGSGMCRAGTCKCTTAS